MFPHIVHQPTRTRWPCKKREKKKRREPSDDFINISPTAFVFVSLRLHLTALCGVLILEYPRLHNTALAYAPVRCLVRSQELRMHDVRDEFKTTVSFNIRSHIYFQLIFAGVLIRHAVFSCVCVYLCIYFYVK